MHEELSQYYVQIIIIDKVSLSLKLNEIIDGCNKGLKNLYDGLKVKFPKFGRKYYWIVIIELSKGRVLNDLSPWSYGDRICLIKSMKDYLNFMCKF